MHHKKSENYYLLALILGILILAFFIFRPFLSAIILAMVFATVFAPIHRRILKITRNRHGIASMISTVSVLIVAVVPLIFIGINIFQEATGLYSSIVSENSRTDISIVVGKALAGAKNYTSLPLEFSVDINQYLKQGLTWLLQHMGPLFSNIANGLMGAFIFLISLYYMFKDGRKLKAFIITLSPLNDTHDEAIVKKLSLAVNSIIRGTLVVAVIQSILAAIGFFIFGIPNPTLWGSTVVVAALIPSVGTALVLIPAVLFLFLSGEIFSAFGLLLWSILVVGLIDNFLKPKFIERDVNIHPLIILLSILGGIGYFGPLGFILGPLVVSLFFALFDIYLSLAREHSSK